MKRYRLKEIRSERKLSQPQLSMLTGISQARVSRIENERAVPTIEEMQRIAKALHVHSLDMWKGEVNQESASS